MKRVNGYVSFNKGDKIKFVDENIVDKYKGKTVEFVRVDGEDYCFYDTKTKDIFFIPARYFNKFKKVDEKVITKIIKTWEIELVDGDNDIIIE